MSLIAHVDMDAFFASIEVHDHPAWRGKPLVVSGNRPGRTVVSTASYEARRYGIHSAMPLAEAKRRYPDLIVVPVHFDRYRQVSALFIQTLRSFSPLVEPRSIDEAYLDLTGCSRRFATPQSLAIALQQAVMQATGLSCSVGLSFGKIFAKIASDLHKPAGITLIGPDQLQSMLWPLPVEKVPGIGPRTLDELHQVGVRTIGALAQLPLSVLARQIGQREALSLHRIANGEDPRPVTPLRVRKSLGKETTFPQDCQAIDTLLQMLAQLARAVAQSAQTAQVTGEVVVVKVRYADFRTTTLQWPLPLPTQASDMIATAAWALFLTLLPLQQSVRLLGVRLTQLRPAAFFSEQLELFGLPPQRGTAAVLAAAAHRFGVEHAKQLECLLPNLHPLIHHSA